MHAQIYYIDEIYAQLEFFFFLFLGGAIINVIVKILSVLVSLTFLNFVVFLFLFVGMNYFNLLLV